MRAPTAFAPKAPAGARAEPKARRSRAGTSASERPAIQRSSSAHKRDATAGSGQACARTRMHVFEHTGRDVSEGRNGACAVPTIIIKPRSPVKTAPRLYPLPPPPSPH